VDRWDLESSKEQSGLPPIAMPPADTENLGLVETREAPVDVSPGPSRFSESSKTHTSIPVGSSTTSLEGPPSGIDL
jgi:hypothetical protein